MDSENNTQNQSNMKTPTTLKWKSKSIDENLGASKTPRDINTLKKTPVSTLRQTSPRPTPTSKQIPRPMTSSSPSITLTEKKKLISEKKAQRDIQRKEKLQRFECAKLNERRILNEAYSVSRNKYNSGDSILLQRKKLLEKQQQEKEYEASILWGRRLDYLQIREAKSIEESKRRQSIAFRLEVARRHKYMDLEEGELKRRMEKLDIETRADLMKDDPDHAKEKDEARRQSLAFRHDAFHRHKQVDEEKFQEEIERQKTIFEFRKQQLQAMVDYKNEEVAREREELLFREEQWRMEKEIEKFTDEEMQEMMRYDRQLHQEEMEDILQHEMKMEAARRQSLAYHAEIANRDKTFEEMKRVEEANKLEMERRGALVDLQAIKEAHRREESRDRESLLFRGEYENMARSKAQLKMERERTTAVSDRIQAIENRVALQSKQQEDRDRARQSIAFRLVQARRQNELAMAAHRSGLDKLHMEFEVKKEDLVDITTYKKEAELRSRTSVQLRLQSWREGRLEEERIEAKLKRQAEQEAELKEILAEDARNAKKAEALTEKVEQLVSDNFVV